eukprot:CAMPEP_0194028138 /NCGR_PEP_ID=MMETSP0009_2-20130614/2161_1 /TAXON_ID=210454 /ORGANISM="Grammatophora oceanica, Strain CCMP 410" /LENGTH=698 /DNA_ID=CAMNT_0038667419 /DNA_START=120 /DNA_END=2216 /DNA_ORIENTATION=+
MKFSAIVVGSVLMADQAMGFAPQFPITQRTYSRSSGSSSMAMALGDMPPANPIQQASSDLPVIEKNAYGQPGDIRYSDFLKLVKAGRIEKVTFGTEGTQLLGVDVDGTRLKIETLPNDPDLMTDLEKYNVDVRVLDGEGASNGLGDLAQSLVFPAILFAGLFFLSRRSGAGGGGGMPGGFGGNNPMGFGKSKAQIMMVPDTGVTFDDVAGCDGAKLELEEVVDFLKTPEAYTKMGANVPRGVILDGPPGTGKTLLAKAVAGEAGVPFINIAGSEFVEMFVGVGASRVRDIFQQAKKNAPCIIFIDEIDAVGRQRGAGYAGGNDEREQTVNQILVEMDGFEGNSGVITMAATNRVDILDQALLRPGRFDRKVTVDLPDFKGRTSILGVHARGKPLEPDVDLEAISRRTPGFSGAQLENLMNEAAINAARKDKATIGWYEIDSAVDRIMVGLEKLGDTSGKMKELVAYHEAGHAIVGACVPDYDIVQKITIIPRSNGAGGLTFFAPLDSRIESGMYSRSYLENNLAVALGGRLAEELIYGAPKVTTGASNDIQQCANVAKRMVFEWGMSEKVGKLAITEEDGRKPFMGMDYMRGQGPTWSDEFLAEAYNEVERLVDNAYLQAKKILTDNAELLEALKERLMDQETVSAEEFQMMLVEFKTQSVPFQLYGSAIDRDLMPYGEDDEKKGVNLPGLREAIMAA